MDVLDVFNTKSSGLWIEASHTNQSGYQQPSILVTNETNKPNAYGVRGVTIKLFLAGCDTPESPEYWKAHDNCRLTSDAVRWNNEIKAEYEAQLMASKISSNDSVKALFLDDRYRLHKVLIDGNRLTIQ